MVNKKITALFGMFVFLFLSLAMVSAVEFNPTELILEGEQGTVTSLEFVIHNSHSNDLTTVYEEISDLSSRKP